jgi:hypothetical protein
MRCKDGSLIIGQVQREFLDFSNGRHKRQYTGGVLPSKRPTVAHFLSIARLRLQRDSDVFLCRKLNCTGVASVGVAEDAHSGIAGENALEPPPGIIGAVGDDNHASVL